MTFQLQSDFQLHRPCNFISNMVKNEHRTKMTGRDRELQYSAWSCGSTWHTEGWYIQQSWWGSHFHTCWERICGLGGKSSAHAVTSSPHKSCMVVGSWSPQLKVCKYVSMLHAYRLVWTFHIPISSGSGPGLIRMMNHCTLQEWHKLVGLCDSDMGTRAVAPRNLSS